MGELLAQGMGELADKIGESGLDIRCSLPQRKAHRAGRRSAAVAGDGKPAQQCVQVRDAALTGVYRRRAFDGTVCITIKNISAFELNMLPEELMERFARGDKSRSSEGSGLGSFHRKKPD